MKTIIESTAQNITTHAEATLSKFAPYTRRATLAIIIRNMRALYGDCDALNAAEEIEYFKKRHSADKRMKMLMTALIVLAIVATVVCLATLFY